LHRPSVYKLRFVAPFFGPILEKIGTPAFRRFMVDICPWKALHEARDIVDIIHETSLEIYAEKKQALADGDEAVAEKYGQGKDIMSILSECHSTTPPPPRRLSAHINLYPIVISAGQYVGV
jgi:hypothetical protein